MATGKELKSFEGLTADIAVLTFAPNGKALAAGFRDGGILIFDASPFDPRPKSSPKLGQDELESCWTDLADDDAMKAKLESLEKKQGLKKLVLAIDNPAGPEKYNVAKDADVTVTLYVKNDIKASYAFKKGEMTEKDVEKIVADVAKILPEKK